MSAPAVRSVEVRLRGKDTLVPGIDVEGRTVITTGRWAKVALVHDEHVSLGSSAFAVTSTIGALRRAELRADVLTFLRQPRDLTRDIAYHVEWENYAAVPITNFEDWWNNLPRRSRSNINRAAKRGVEVRPVEFSDTLVRGIHRICNETPVRQGRDFWHFGKNLEQLRREHATYLERSQFIGAYFEGDLIGYVKVIYTGKVASIVSILGLVAHRDKRHMNALLAKTIEICAQRGIEQLVYGNYTHGNKRDCSLAEFKHRNGFTKVNYPRFYVPLTFKGRVYVACKLFRGAIGLIPAPILSVLLKIRRRLALQFAAETASKT